MSQEAIKLQERQREKLAEARRLHSKALEADASAEEIRDANEKHDRAMEDFDDLQGQIDKLQEREKRMAAAEAQMDSQREFVKERAEERGTPDAEVRRQLDEIQKRLDALGEGKRPMGRGAGDDDKARLRRCVVRNIFKGSPSVDEEERSWYHDQVRSASNFNVRQLQDMAERMDMEMPEQRAQDSSNPTNVAGTAGGILIPTTVMDEVIIQKAMIGPMLDPTWVTLQQTADGSPTLWPRTDTSGAEGEWIAENSPATTGDITFNGRSIAAKIASSKVVLIPRSLAQDSAAALETVVRSVFAERLWRTANKGLTETQTGGPGAVTNQAGLSVSGATRPTVAEWNAQDEKFDLLLDRLVRSVDPIYHGMPTCGFMFHFNEVINLRRARDTQKQYLWQMGDVRTGTPAMIMGWPYRVNQAMKGASAIVANDRVAGFGDWSKWITRESMMPEALVLRERYAENFQIGMIAFARWDGGLVDDNAIKFLQVR